MRETLFRTEVMRAQSTQWLGTIRIGRPPSFAWLTGIALLLLAGLLAFALLGEISRKARVSGVLLPTGGLIGITAPQSGTVAELLVKEGEEVRAVQPLLKIRTERRLAQGDVALLNAAATLVVAGKAKDLKDGVALGAKALDTGAAEGRLRRLIAVSAAA